MSSMRARDLKLGEAIEFNKEVYIVFDKHEQTRGNLRTYWQIKLKSFERGNVVEHRFSPDDMLPLVYLERAEYEYLYAERENYVFMHPETYEQEILAKSMLNENGQKFLMPNLKVTLLRINGVIMGIEMPLTIESEVKESPDSERGDTATNVTKIAIIDTGAEVRVPGYVKVGDIIKIRVENGEFQGRVKR
ncbi:MAG: elongation factor P [Planctomycetota bacterium]